MELKTVQIHQWAQIKKIYPEAFPKAERKPFFLLKNSKKTTIYTAVERDTLFGFVATVELRNMVMIDYLAVDSKARGKGAGSFLLQEICQRFPGRKMVLRIEKPDRSAENQRQRVARRRFYLKNGFTSSELLVKGVSGTMEILNFGGRVSPKQYLELQEYALGRLLFK